MSRLINIDAQIQQESEPEGYEFGYYTFDTLPTMEFLILKLLKIQQILMREMPKRISLLYP